MDFPSSASAEAIAATNTPTDARSQFLTTDQDKHSAEPHYGTLWSFKQSGQRMTYGGWGCCENELACND